MKSKIMIVFIIIISVLIIGYLYITKFNGGKTITAIVKEIDNDNIVLILIDNTMMGEMPDMNNNGDRPQRERPSDEDFENRPVSDGEFPSFDGNGGPRRGMMLGEETTYSIDNNATIKNENGDSATISDIASGGFVTVKVVFGKVKEITINQSGRNFNRPNMNNHDWENEG